MTTTKRNTDLLNKERSCGFEEKSSAAVAKTIEKLNAIGFGDSTPVLKDSGCDNKVVDKPPLPVTPKKKKTKRKRFASDELVPIIQPPIVPVCLDVRVPVRNHNNRSTKRQEKHSGHFARPQMGLFNHTVDISEDTSAALGEFTNMLGKVSDIIDSKLPDEKERGQVADALKNLTDAVHKISDKNVADEISAYVDALKTDIRQTMESTIPDIRDGVLYLAFASACIAQILKPTPIRACAVGATLALVITMTRIPENKHLLLMVVTTFGTVVSYGLASSVDDSNPEITDASPQMDFEDMNKGIGAVTSMMAVYVSAITGKNAPVELFKNLGAIDRVKSGVSDVVKILLDVLERVVNWFRNTVLDKPNWHFFHTQNDLVNSYCDKVRSLCEEERTGKLHRTRENFTKVAGICTEGEYIKAKMPREKNTFGACSLLDEQLRDLKKIKADFERMEFDLCGARQEAVGLLLKGAPGVGKSITMEALNYAICARVLSDEDFSAFKSQPSNFVYNRQFETKYWDGYDSNKLICMFDDFGQAKDIAGNPDGEAMNIIRAGSGFEMDMHCAHMDLKGVVKFHSKFLFATTNLPQLRFESIISTEAAERRFDFHVIVVPKPQYCTEETRDKGYFERRLDYSKLRKVKVEETGFYNTGVHEVSNLDPTVHHFYVCKKANKDANYEPDGDPITFEQLVDLLENCYQNKRLQFLNGTKILNDIALKQRKKRAQEKYTEHLKEMVRQRFEGSPGVEDLRMRSMPELSAKKPRVHFATPQMDMPGEADPGEDEFYDAVDSDEQAPPGVFNVFNDAPILTNVMFPQERFGLNGEENDVGFQLECEHIQEAVQGEQSVHIDVKVPYAHWKENTYPRDLENALQDLSRLHLGSRLDFTLDPRDINAYPASVQRLVAYFQRYYDKWSDDVKMRSLDVIDDIFHARFAHSEDYISIPLGHKLCIMIEQLGPEFASAWFSGQISEYQWNTTWNRRNLPIQLKHSIIPVVDHTEEIKSFGVQAKELYDKAMNSHPFLKWVNEITGRSSIIVGILGLVTSTFVYKMLYKVVSYFTGVKLPEPESMGHSDKLKDRHHKIYHKSAAQLKKDLKISQTPTDAVPQSDLDPNGDAIAKRIGKENVYELHMEATPGSGSLRKLGYVIMVCGRIGMMPHHFIANIAARCAEDPKYLDAKMLLQRPGRTHAFPFLVRDLISGHETGVLKNYDLVLVQFPRTVQLARNIVEYFAMKGDYNRISLNIPFMLYYPNKDGAQAYVYGTSYAQDVPLPVSSDTLGRYLIRKHYVYHGFTANGDCGAPYFVLNSTLAKRKLFGVHVAGSKEMGQAYSAAVCQEDLLEDLKMFEQQFDIDCEPSDVKEQINMEPFSNGQFDEFAVVTPCPNRNLSSNIIHSRLFSAWKPALTAPACLRRKMVNGKLIDPVASAQSKYCFGPVWFDMNKVLRARDILYAHLTHVSKRRVEPVLLTYRQALNGIENEINFHGIASSTSAGYPMNVSGKRNMKKYLFEFGREGDVFEARFAEVCDEIRLVEEKYKNGVRPAWFFSDCLKDERRPIDKVIEGKTRMFSGCPFYYLIIFKKYFGAFTLELIENNILNGSIVGANPYSTDWHSLAQNLTRFDPKGFSCVGAGDYSAFDGSEKPTIHFAVLDIVNRWYGDSDENQKVRHLLWLELVNSRHIMDGVAYQWSSSLPSGHPFTIWVNNMYNFMAFLLCWDDLGLDMKIFFDNVYVCVCGDDNIFTVHPEYREIFNEITICKPMSKLGLTYTTETKGEATLPFRNLEDVEFLKRGFRFDPTLGVWLAPLRLDVVLEIPYWTKATSDRNKIAVSNVDQTLNELSLYDKAVFDEWSKKIIKTCRERYPDEEPPRPLDLSYRERQEIVRGTELFF